MKYIDQVWWFFFIIYLVVSILAAVLLPGWAWFPIWITCVLVCGFVPYLINKWEKEKKKRGDS